MRTRHLSFEAYNESGYLQEAVKRYHERTGHYPERVRADQIYRMREDRKFCKRLATQLISIVVVFAFNVFMERLNK